MVHAGLEELGGDVREQILQDSRVEVVTHELMLDYSYWTTEQVLKVHWLASLQMNTSFCRT